MSGELEPLGRHELRASHEDRDLVVDRLRIAAGDGRIDGDELDQRIEAAMAARTYGELEAVVRDLPDTPEVAALARAVRPAALEPEQTITVSHGTVGKYGPWQVPERLLVSSRHGSVVLDFTGAVFVGPREVEVVLDVAHSSVRLVLPDGSAVDDTLVVRRHADVNARGFELSGPGGVVVRLTGSAAHSSVRARRLSARKGRLRLRRSQRREIGR